MIAILREKLNTSNFQSLLMLSPPTDLRTERFIGYEHLDQTLDLEYEMDADIVDDDRTGFDASPGVGHMSGMRIGQEPPDGVWAV